MRRENLARIRYRESGVGLLNAALINLHFIPLQTFRDIPDITHSCPVSGSRWKVYSRNDGDVVPLYFQSIQSFRIIRTGIRGCGTNLLIHLHLYTFSIDKHIIKSKEEEEEKENNTIISRSA